MVMAATDWGAVGAFVGIATFVVALATLIVSAFLYKLTKADSATQAAIRSAAEATKAAAEASRRTSEAAYVEARLDNRRGHLWGLVQSVEELNIIFTTLGGRDDLQRAWLHTAKMSSFMERLEDDLPACRKLVEVDNLWTNIAVTEGAIVNARAELRRALLGHEPPSPSS